MSLPWLEASLIEPQTVHYVRSSFATTKRQNKVSKESVLCGSDNIGVKGKTIIEAQAVIRGDLSTIELGSYCVIARGAVIRPAEQQFQGRTAYIPMTIGDHVIIEENSIVEAAVINDCTHIGKNCQIGPRCVISPCCEILDGSVLAANSVTAPFSVWGGCPAVQVGRLPESFQLAWQKHTRSFYRHFQPMATATSGASAASTPARPPRPPRPVGVSSSTDTPITSPSPATPLASPRGVAGALASPPLPPARHRTASTILSMAGLGSPAPSTPTPAATANEPPATPATPGQDA